MTTQDNQATNNQDTQKSALDKRLDAIGWGLFLIMIGGLWLLPEGMLPDGTWLIGMGVIILGLSAYRIFIGIRVSGFWTVIGILALGFGLSEVFYLDLPLIPILLILFGVSMIYKYFTKKEDAENNQQQSNSE